MRTRMLTGAAVAALGLLGAGSAAADERGFSAQFAPGARQFIDNSYTSRRPGTATGTTTRVEYRDPANPNGKPPAVRRIVDVFPAGTRFDVRGAPACNASDAELMARGAAACPPGSRIGGGFVEFVTGFGPPVDPLVFDNITFNNANGPIMLVTERRSGVRAVNRVRQEGRRFITEIQPIPGTPPDGAALLRADLPVDRRSQNGHNLITTPRSCPRSRRWTFDVTFTYSDGVQQREIDGTPCVLSAQQRRAARRRTPSFTG